MQQLLRFIHIESAGKVNEILDLGLTQNELKIWPCFIKFFVTESANSIDILLELKTEPFIHCSVKMEYDKCKLIEEPVLLVVFEEYKVSLRVCHGGVWKHWCVGEVSRQRQGVAGSYLLCEMVELPETAVL